MSLLIVSNRVPKLGKHSAGGLVSLMEDALGRGDTWLGWNGQYQDRSRAVETSVETNPKGVHYATFPFNVGTGKRFYRPEGDNPNGESDFTNGTLWPLFHGIQADPVNRTLLQAYQVVNEQFASRTAKAIKPDTDAIWVHDYHLMGVGERLRNKGVDKPLGFFLHIPFPSQEERAQLAPDDRKKVFGGLMSYDLVGFQTRKDRDHFTQMAVSELGAKQGPDGSVISATGRTVRTGIYPAGIDPQMFQNMDYTRGALKREDAAAATAGAGNNGAAHLLEKVGDRKMILSVERMDPAKGVLERMKEFKTFLDDNPEQRDRVAMVQIGNITRQGVPAYVKYRADVLKEAQEINALYGRPGKDAVILTQATYTRNQLAHLYHNSSVVAVTSLADGMNLVVKEAVGAFDPRRPAAVILGKGVGAAENMADGAIVVDARRPGSIAKGIAMALDMPLEESIDRHKIMLNEVNTNTATSFGQRFHRDLLASASPGVVPIHAAPKSNRLGLDRPSAPTVRGFKAT